jgi:hypothetical protein
VILLIALPVLYILSSGPGNWLTLKGYLSPNAAAVVYAPLFWVVDRCPAPAQDSFGRWASFWHPSDWNQKIHEQLGEALAKEIFQGMADDLTPFSGTESEELENERSFHPHLAAKGLSTVSQVQPPTEDAPIYYFNRKDSLRVEREHDTRGYARVASEIATAFKGAGICGFDVEITVTRDVITLAGNVASPDQRIAAERLAASVGEPRGVDNRLRIAAGDE